MKGCDHKFDSNYCLKCGWTPPRIEAERVRLSEADVDALRVWHRLVLRSQQHAFAQDCFARGVAAGREEQRKVDAEAWHEVARQYIECSPGWAVAREIADRIERAPAEPTVAAEGRCFECGGLRNQKQSGCAQYEFHDGR